MVVSPGGKKTAGAHKRPRRTRLATLQPVFPCGLMPVKHERRAVSPPEFTTLTHNDSLLERFLRWPRVCCSRLGATAHLSGQKLLTFQGIYQHCGATLTLPCMTKVSSLGGRTDAASRLSACGDTTRRVRLHTGCGRRTLTSTRPWTTDGRGDAGACRLP